MRLTRRLKNIAIAPILHFEGQTIITFNSRTMSTPESKQAALAAMRSVADARGSIADVFTGVDEVGDESVGAFATMRDFFARKLS